MYYFITGLTEIKGENIYDLDYNTNCFGFFADKKKARESLKDISQFSYKYMVIEEYEEGVQTIAKSEEWYEYQGDLDKQNGEYIKIDRPDKLGSRNKVDKRQGVINFAIG